MAIRKWNRRTERREGQFGKLVGWQKSKVKRGRRNGWLYDLSESGVSFFVETQYQPALGNDVKLFFDTALERGQYEVIRVEPMSGNLTLIGCQKVGANGVIAPLKQGRPSDSSRSTCARSSG